MKPVLKIGVVFLTLSVITLISSCGNKIDNGIEAVQKMEAKYIAACNEKDFDKARKIVAEMEPEINILIAEINTKLAKMQGTAAATEGTHGFDGTSSDKHWNEFYAAQTEYSSKIKPLNVHWKYVNEKEIYSLLAKPTNEGDQRILFLYNQYESYELPDMGDVVEVAMSMGDENLPIRLIKAGWQPTERTVLTAVNNDFPEYVELAISKCPYLLKNKKEIQDYYIVNFGQDKFDKLMNN